MTPTPRQGSTEAEDKISGYLSIFLAVTALGAVPSGTAMAVAAPTAELARQAYARGMVPPFSSETLAEELA